MERPHAYHADRMDFHVVKNSCLKWLCNRNDFQSQISKTKNKKKQNKNNDDDDRLWLQYQTESFKVDFFYWIQRRQIARTNRLVYIWIMLFLRIRTHTRLSKVVLKYNSTHMNQGLDKGLNSACSACPIQKWILFTVSTKVHVDKVINWRHPCINWASTPRGDAHAPFFPRVTFTSSTLSALYAWGQFRVAGKSLFRLTTSNSIAMIFTV